MEFGSLKRDVRYIGGSQYRESTGVVFIPRRIIRLDRLFICLFNSSIQTVIKPEVLLY